MCSFYDFNKSLIFIENNEYRFKYLGNLYYIIEIFNEKEVFECFEISNRFNFFDEFILNINNSIVSFYNNKKFVLLKKCNGKFINNIKISNSIYLSWKNIFIDNSYYFESIYNDVINDDLLGYYDYYMYLLELSILYLNNYKNYTGIGYLTHKKYDSDNYCNPLNIKIDFLERDFGEYLKYVFMNKEYYYLNLDEIINEKYYYMNYDLVLSRLLYPNYFFELLENKNYYGIKKLNERIFEFENYLKMIVFIIKKNHNIRIIDYFY